MQARGPLMIEHRLIEQMIALIRGALSQIQTTGKIDPHFVDAAVDFIRIYADRTHHGKEEDILFHYLEGKPLSEGDRRVMNELIQEHRFGRQTTRALVEANTRYRRGETTALTAIAEQLGALVDFYPKHIAKEDRVFFPASRTYFTADEDRAILAEFGEFDRRMIHEKYRSVVEGLKA